MFTQPVTCPRLSRGKKVILLFSSQINLSIQVNSPAVQEIPSPHAEKRNSLALAAGNVNKYNNPLWEHPQYLAESQC